MDKGSADYEAISKFATYKEVFSGEDNSTRAEVTFSGADFTPEMARSYEIDLSVTFGADKSMIEKKFTVSFTYKYKNGTRVLDYPNGEFEHPEVSNDANKKEDTKP